MIFQSTMPPGNMINLSDHVQKVREKFENGWTGVFAEQIKEMRTSVPSKVVRRSNSDVDTTPSNENKFRPVSVVEMTRLFEANGPTSLPDSFRGVPHVKHDSCESSLSEDKKGSIIKNNSPNQLRELSPERPPRRKEKCLQNKIVEEEMNSEKISNLGPLPVGPAPQKPPRTFEHDLYIMKKDNDICKSPNPKLSLEERRKHRACLSKPPVKPVKPIIVRKTSDPEEVMPQVNDNDNKISEPFNCDSSSKKVKRPAEPPPPVPVSTNELKSVPDNSVISKQGGNSLLKCFSAPFQQTCQYESISDVILRTDLSRNVNRNLNCFSNNTEHIYSELETPESTDKSDCRESQCPIYAIPFNDIDIEIKDKKEAGQGLHYMSTPVANYNANSRNSSFNPLAKCTNEINNIVNKVFGNMQRESCHEDTFDSFESLNSIPSDFIISGPNINSSDSDSDVLETQKAIQETEKRKTYIKNVSRKASDACKQEFTSPYRHLFECVLIVGLYYDTQNNCYKPVINSSFPAQAKYPAKISSFCYPDAIHWSPTEKVCKQTYCLVLTDQNGKRRFGYCKRMAPDSNSSAESIAYCLISPFRAHSFYSKVLEELVSKHTSSESCRKSLLQNLYGRSLPKPGNTISIFDTTLTQKSVIKIKRSVDSRLEDTQVSELIESLDFTTLMKVLGTVFQERRLIMCSKHISKLTNCVHAIESLLYPFSWQHIFIPILPSDLLEFCAAPMPFIIGILKPDYSQAAKFQDDYMLVVDIDESVILHSVGDEATILPAKIHRCLGNALELVQKFTKEAEPARNLLISEFFIRLFVEACGHYQKHIVTTNNNGVSEFKRLEFIRGVKSKSIQNFLDWFSETAMFTCFIDQKTSGNDGESGLFDRRIYEQFSDMESGTQNLMKNAQKMFRKVKPFGEKWL